jgi:hypothetical protein
LKLLERYQPRLPIGGNIIGERREGGIVDLRLCGGPRLFREGGRLSSAKAMSSARAI